MWLTWQASLKTSLNQEDAIKTKGYFIYPSQLFANIAANAHNNANLNTDLAAIFTAIESSANGYPSEPDIKGLFADFDTTSNPVSYTHLDVYKRQHQCRADGRLDGGARRQHQAKTEQLAQCVAGRDVLAGCT